MAPRLLPREESFFDLFNDAARNMLDAARMLKDLLEDFRDAEQRAEAIKALEDKGDEITHDIIDRLNRTFVTPLDREDIFGLAKQLDDVLDWIEAAAARMAVYKITATTPEAKELGLIIVSECEAVSEAVRSLRRLPEMYAHIKEINRLENLADRLQRDAIAKLFAARGDAIDVMKWKEIYETLEEATDQGEHVAHVLEGIYAKHT